MALFKTLKGKNSIKGNISNFISMLSYAFYPAFLTVFALINKSDDTYHQIVIASAIVAGKEFFTFIVFVAINGIPKIFKTLKHNMRGKFGLLAILAGVLGGPVGFTFLTIGIYMMGAASPDAIVLSFSIIVAFVLERIIFKKRVTKLQLLGMAFTILGASLLIVLQQSKDGISSELLMGLFFAFGGAIAWGGEAVMADYVMKNNPMQMNSNDFLSIKLFSSSIISFILMFVFSGIFTQDNTGFNTFKRFFTETDLLLKILVVGATMVLARWMFFYGINKTSSVITSTVVTLQIIALPIFIMIFNFMGYPPLSGDNVLVYDYRFWLIAIFITIGTILASVNIKELYYNIFKNNTSKL